MDAYSPEAMNTIKNAANSSRRFGVMKARIGTTQTITEKGKRDRVLTVESLNPDGSGNGGLKVLHPKAKTKVICTHRACRGATFATFAEMRGAHDSHDELVRANESHVVMMLAFETVDGKDVDLGVFSDQPYTDVRYQEM